MKGVVLVILPAGSKVSYDTFRDFRLPEGLRELVSDRISLMYLPKGGGFYMGETGTEVLEGFHEEIHKLLGEKCQKEVSG